MNLKVLSILFMLTIALCSCKKHSVKPSPVPDLPAATQTGANVIAWHTDSIPYISRGDFNNATVTIDTNKKNPFFYNKGQFLIISLSVNNNGYHRAINLSSATNITFPIIPGTVFPISSGSFNFMSESAGDNGKLLIFGANNGQITITYFDMDKKIISGTFAFITGSDAKYTARNISDGWFDCKFQLSIVQSN